MQQDGSYTSAVCIRLMVLCLGEDLKSTMNDVQRQTTGTCLMCLSADLVVFALDSASTEAASVKAAHIHYM